MYLALSSSLRYLPLPQWKECPIKVFKVMVYVKMFNVKADPFKAFLVMIKFVQMACSIKDKANQS